MISLKNFKPMNMNSSATTNKWLSRATRQLTQAGIITARLDSLIFLEDITGRNRASILAHPEQALSASQLKKLSILIARRSAHEPLAYIRGETEFYGRKYKINHRVLEPRPESETMIDLLKELPEAENATIIDIGTGSGALAITAQLEIPGSKVIATDIDAACLKIAAANAKTHKTSVTFLRGDLLDPVLDEHTSPLILLCNLPYVPDSFQINPAALQEPRIAIFGGPDGLDVYRKLFDQLKSRTSSSLHVLTESMPPQHIELERIASDAHLELLRTDDFVQVFRKT
jgi:release factor glutamine methyltransferase